MNSPFWCGRATGHQSHRIEVTSSIPGGGLPPRLGDWAGGQKTFAIPAGPAGLKTAILVQSGTGGPILAAAKG